VLDYVNYVQGAHLPVVGFAWPNESRSYAGGSVVTGRASHARLVCDEDPD
jgi:hypothetical protein